MSEKFASLKTAGGLPDTVYDQLLDLLTWGNLPPDSGLSIDGLAAQLEVSPTPVREALARLEATGLVQRKARRGYRVAKPMSQAQMRELVDARLVLEMGTIARAMQHRNELLPDLEAAFKRHQKGAQRILNMTAEDNQQEAVRDYFADDWSFHEAILNHCGNRYLVHAVNSLSFRVHRMRQAIGSGVSDAEYALAEHLEILEAVRRGDTAGAVAAMERHLDKLDIRVAQN